MTADAVVIAARADGSVDLEFRPKLCGGCAGTCLWRRLQATRIEGLRHSGNLAPGTEVAVALPERRVLTASLVLYGLPLAALLAGAAAGAAVFATDAGTLIGAGVGLFAMLAGLGPLGRRLERLTLAKLVIRPRE